MPKSMMTSFAAAVTRPNEPWNRLLARMPGSDLALLQSHMKPVTLKFRQRLESANRKTENAYFIEQGLASVVAISTDRRQAEVAVVGREGMTGLPVVLGADRSPNEVFMQVEGRGQCIAADALRNSMRTSTSLSAYLLRYAHAFSVQTTQTALANAQGKIEERLARWLLMAQDRMGSAELSVTHEFLAIMLGVRRPGVTMALHQLEARNLISTARGNIAVVDRDGLQHTANGFYGTAEAEYRRLFPDPELPENPA